MKTKNFPHRKEERRNSAVVHNLAREKRTAQEQIERLQRNGHGHCKEVARLKEMK
jgi:hypothetical protein